MVGWHHQFIGHELRQTLGDVEGQGGLACCSPWSNESDTTQQLNSKKNTYNHITRNDKSYKGNEQGILREKYYSVEMICQTFVILLGILCCNHLT